MKYIVLAAALGCLLTTTTSFAEPAKGGAGGTAVDINQQTLPPARAGTDLAGIVDPSKIQAAQPSFSMSIRWPTQAASAAAAPSTAAPTPTRGGPPPIPAAQGPGSASSDDAKPSPTTSAVPTVSIPAANPASAPKSSEDVSAMLQQANTPVKVYSTLQAAAADGIDPLNERTKAEVRAEPVVQPEPKFDWRSFSSYRDWVEMNLDLLLVALGLAVAAAALLKLLKSRRS